MLDSYALLAFLFKEAGYEKVLALLDRASESDDTLLVAAPNWAEVCYVIERKVGEKGWEEARTKLLGLPIEVVPADETLAQMAGKIKVKHRMSLADCFAAALAKERGVEVYTGDLEFRSVEKEVKVIWI